MKVVSLFDGISCGMVALKKQNINVEKYIAYEIEKNAIIISKKNHKEIEHRGDVIEADFSEFIGFDLLIGGSPCQDLNPASCGGAKSTGHEKKGLDGEKSGLFFKYVKALETIKPRYFLFENVASMKKVDMDTISKYLGVEPIMIDSSLLSPQKRKRLYWTNIPNVTQPNDLNIVLSDVMVKKQDVEEKYFHTQKAIALMNREVGSTGRKRLYNGQGVTFDGVNKCGTITANFKKGVPYNVYVYTENDMRKFLEVECERLQGLPDDYTFGISQTKRYECIGNGWNVDTIAHIFSFLPGEVRNNK